MTAMPEDIRVQIYTMQSVAEAAAIAALRVDHVGVTPSSVGLPGEIGDDLAREICREIADSAASVALSVADDLDAIDRMVRAVRPDILHLCGPPGAVDPGRVVELRRILPEVAVMQAIAVTGPEAVAEARSFAGVVDFLILDSLDPDIAGVGAAGTVHDWEVSAAIVAAVDVPVVLAGGLTPANVSAAISVVGPWGVDSLSHTNRPSKDGGFRKDRGLVAEFASAARRTGAA